MNEPQKETISKATTLLFHIAAGSHTLREIFGIEISEQAVGGRITKIALTRKLRPWLVKHPTLPTEHGFDPEKFAKMLFACSDGQRYMMQWILNVWNPGYAATKRDWRFDLFAAIRALDQENTKCITMWMSYPIFP